MNFEEEGSGAGNGDEYLYIPRYVLDNVVIQQQKRIHELEEKVRRTRERIRTLQSLAGRSSHPSLANSGNFYEGGAKVNNSHSIDNGTTLMPPAKEPVSEKNIPGDLGRPGETSMVEPRTPTMTQMPESAPHGHGEPPMSTDLLSDEGYVSEGVLKIGRRKRYTRLIGMMSLPAE
mmetsp:Transcript_12169/g.50417  ORF Transcript_12169/g.50417 Transcript_12169/m.50417 type:complete len:175 (-) Transcript_12169:302-826(-)